MQHYTFRSGSRLQNWTPPLPQAANLDWLSSLPFWVGGCHGNSKALQAFLVTDQAWKTILESTALCLWEILMKELPDPASVPHRGNGRDVRCCCAGRGSGCQKDRHWGETGGEAEQCPCPLLLPQGEKLSVTAGGAAPTRGCGVRRGYVRPCEHSSYSGFNKGET